MSEARAITNLIGNAVATVAVARWQGALDLDLANRTLRGDVVDAADDPVVPGLVVPLTDAQES
jgi:Na+/H+-dicarboxylate symporter